jgi:hypothetical protein
VQVQQRQHLRDLRRLAAPRRQDGGGEPLALAGDLIDALVVHARGDHLDRAGRGEDLAGLVVTVAHHQPVTLLIPFLGQLGDVGIDFGLQRGSQHATGALADDLVDQRMVWRVVVAVDYGKHGRTLPTGTTTPVCSVTFDRSPGKVRLPHALPGPIHRS